ncbi:hypothetical protein [Naumannella halotolerans]|uniref:Uncharacterized protein n=1 Tax=Naumannella halotolerans TaxID=993414 RepID=A0A4R7J296_9ACTN|nr:hypothetical protein [Naumannella halotolerans]TDT31311.1 hypothetical protein CLV29_2727 [Naumannella halotolerans]
MVAELPGFHEISRSAPGMRQYSPGPDEYRNFEFLGRYVNPIQAWFMSEFAQSPDGPEDTEFNASNGPLGMTVVADYCEGDGCAAWATYAPLNNLVVYVDVVAGPNRLASADEAAQQVCASWRALELVQECDDLEFVPK